MGLEHNLVVVKERLLGWCSLGDRQFVCRIARVLQYIQQFVIQFYVGDDNIGDLRDQ
jgi:hypothetical protein